MNSRWRHTRVIAGRWVLFALTLALVFVAGPAAALENLGIVAGIDRTQLTGDEPRDFRYQQETGYLVGAVVEFALARDFLLSIQPGYLNTRTSIAYKDRQTGELRDSLSLNMDWIVMPVLARINVTDSVVYATGGLDLAIGIGGGLSGGQVDEPIDTFIRDVDVAALIGVGIELPAGRYRITAELRYRQGLLNLAREDFDAEGSGLPARFRLAGMQLQVGLLVPLGGP